MTSMNGPGNSVTPTQGTLSRHGRSMSNHGGGDKYGPKEGLLPLQEGRDGRSLSNVSVMFGPRGPSLAPLGPPPGSFSSDLKSATVSRVDTPRSDLGGFASGDYINVDSATTSEQRQIDLRDKINKETKIKIGSENLLEALISKSAKQTKDQRLKVESELSSSNRKIVELKSQLESEIDRANRPGTPGRRRLSGLFQGSPLKSPAREDEASEHEQQLVDLESESPTYILADILQALEVEGMPPDYYVERANNLVELFKRYPALKYDLAWAIFGLRVQTMLLSDSREVVAAGYRVTRHAIADRKSLQTIRGLSTDSMVILSLVKEGKANIEREQALKFVRAFLDVKDGVYELSNAVIRTIVSIAEHQDDRLRSMALLTLSELLIRNPLMVVIAEGVASLADTLVEGNYYGSETLATAFLHLFDSPQQRKYLRSGHELDAAFTPFTDSAHGDEEKLKASARLISATLKTWPGISALSIGNFSPIRSLFLSLYYQAPLARSLILDMLFDVLNIKLPSWTSSYLAGRRLTTYGRVANLKSQKHEHSFGPDQEDQSRNFSLVEHFTTLLLTVFIHCGLLKALSDLVEDASDTSLKRKTTLLLGEILKLANHSLASTVSAKLQVMPTLIASTSDEVVEDYPLTSRMVYQMESINRTLYRSRLQSNTQSTSARTQEHANLSRASESTKHKIGTDVDDVQFRSLLLETQVLATTSYQKWRWDLINDLIEGPLLNPRRLEETTKASKFLKRLIGFYQPLKHRFSDVRNTKPNQRYVRTGCTLIKTLLQTPEGIAYLSESKLLRQLAGCLAPLDRMGGLTSFSPLFSPYRLSETLTGGYFALLGALSSDPKGLGIIEHWRMINMFYSIMDLKDRDDLIQVLLGNMDFALDSHLRVMLSKGLTACPKNTRIYTTRLLRRYATAPPRSNHQQEENEPAHCEWAIRLLVTQLYDPEIEVCEVAVQILEEACNQKRHLEYVVRCRPALDHLGEIGAPLLLRFLSTSLGYRYLDGLDYITQEMDDWFLGRNDSYVKLVEASLSRALSEQPSRPKSTDDEHMQPHEYGIVPPHFYRELTRTAEGCKLLQKSGHFGAFVGTIQELWSEVEDHEAMLKVKGCLWAVGNVGSMELGAPFLEETDVVTWIVKIATESEIMTMRGTAFFVLGLISRSLHGMEIVAEHGWIAASDHLGRSLGYCIPPDIGMLFSLSLDSRWNLPESARKAKKGVNLPVFDDDPLNARILSLVADLGNTVLTKRAAGDLYSLKSKATEPFSSTLLFRKVMFLLESHSFRLPVRRFVIDLFDKSVMRHIVLDDESEDD